MIERVYDFIVDFALEKGYLPTFREIGKGVGLKSSSSVAYYMNKLVCDRRIEPVDGLSRYVVKGLRYRYDS